jgi:polyferredoxin
MVPLVIAMMVDKRFVILVVGILMTAIITVVGVPMMVVIMVVILAVGILMMAIITVVVILVQARHYWCSDNNVV